MKNLGPKVWWSVALTVVVGLLIFSAMQLEWMRLWMAWSVSATLVTALAFFFDKARAAKKDTDGAEPSENGGKGRIPEATLLWLCLIGGTVGGIGMMLWRRHKTRDRKFLLGLVGIIILQALVIGVMLGRGFLGGGSV